MPRRRPQRPPYNGGFGGGINPAVLADLDWEAAGRGLTLEQLLNMRAPSINPRTGAQEFFFDEASAWLNDRKKWLGEKLGFSSDNQSSEQFDLSGEASGLGAEIARVTGQTGIERGRYADRVHALGPYDDDLREIEKAESRERLPRVSRDMTKAVRPGLKKREGSSGHANRTNPTVDAWGVKAKWAGPALGAVDAGLGVYRAINAENPWREGAGVAGSLLGGVAGGAGGAAIGSAYPGLGTVVGAVGGSIAGGEFGERAGYSLYDEGAELYDKYRKYLNWR